MKDVLKIVKKNEIFNKKISKLENGFYNATELVKAGNIWRLDNNLSLFNMAQYFNSQTTKEFLNEIEQKYKVAKISGRGRNSQTWVHPVLFIDIALAINPKLKIEVYEWLFDNLIKFRNDSGDSYREMSAAIFIRTQNKREFPEYIKRVANYIKQQLKVKDWQTATEEQLKKRDLIHNSIRLLCNVLNDTDQAVRIGIKENL